MKNLIFLKNLSFFESFEFFENIDFFLKNLSFLKNFKKKKKKKKKKKRPHFELYHKILNEGASFFQYIFNKILLCFFYIKIFRKIIKIFNHNFVI